MTVFPLLPLPPSEPGRSPQSPQGFEPSPRVSPGRQSERLGPKFERLRSTLDRGAALSLRKDPSSIAPERALVFEVAGSIADFNRLVSRVPGLEFLGDEETAFDPDDDFFVMDNRKGREGRRREDRAVGGRVYVAMPDLAALRELLSLWSRWQEGRDLGHGRTPWRDIFASLRDIRPWGVADRIPEETIAFLDGELGVDPQGTRQVEIELWYHEAESRRKRAHGRVADVVAEAGGRVVHQSTIEAIRYQAALVELPVSEVRRLINREEVHLAICDEAMFVRPQSSIHLPEAAETALAGEAPAGPIAADVAPVAALFDAMPVQNHRLLDGRLEVDDPDGMEGTSVVSERRHGTAMASLILHGDRQSGEARLGRTLHVRPVLYAPGGGDRERPARDRLLVDTIYRAVRRMKEGDSGEGPTAPEVFLVNLSLGDTNRPFAGAISPWARLLDFLADTYGILFLVSAGNVTAPLAVPEFRTWSEFEDADPVEREREVVRALGNNRALRTLLSPAEALNVLTVGAWHSQAGPGPHGAMAVDPYSEDRLPNISSAQGLGHRKTIKPEIHLPGGRERVRMSGSATNPRVVPARGHGLMAAAPDATGTLDREARIPGTSAATALATRAAHRIFDALMDEDGGSMHADIDPRYRAVVVKALLVHRSGWGEGGVVVDDIYGPHGQGKHVERKDNVARLLGYGFPVVEEAMACTPNRATLVGYGSIGANETRVHRIPLPPSLERVVEPRSVTLTVTWISPINPRHRMYRGAKIEVGTVQGLKDAVGVDRASDQPSALSAARGSVYHSRYEGKLAVPFVDDGYILLRLNCREQAGSLDRKVRYGVAVSIEAGESIPVYDEVRTRLGVGVRPPGGV